MSKSLMEALRADIACHEASLFTTPHLSRIHHAEVALLALLEETNSPRKTVPDGDTLTPVRWEEPPYREGL